MYNSPMNKRKLIVIIGLAAVFPLIYLYFLLFPVLLSRRKPPFHLLPWI